MSMYDRDNPLHQEYYRRACAQLPLRVEEMRKEDDERVARYRQQDEDSARRARRLMDGLGA